MHVRSIMSLVAAASIAGMLAPQAMARQETKPAAAQPAPKQPADATLPAAEDLFKRHIAALGGEEALRAEKNRVTKGRVQLKGQPSPGQLTILRVSPNKMYSTLDIPGTITVETWCDGERAWMRDSNGGARAITGEALAETKRISDFMGEANYKPRYSEIHTTGRDKLGGKDVLVVEGTTQTGRKKILYFDAESGLLAGLRSPSDRGPEFDTVVTMSEYKQFGAVMQPTKVVQKVGPDETITTYTSIDANVNPMKNVEPPDEIRNLK